MPLFAAILHGPESSSKLSDCFHTAEVAGSNPASPTLKIQPALSLRHNVSPAKRSVKLTLSWSAVVIRSVLCCVDRGASPEAGDLLPFPRPAIAASSSQQHQLMCLHALAPNGAYPRPIQNIWG